MNSPKLQPTQSDARDALFDDIERELLALTTASLDEDEVLPGNCVDEFANEFLAELSLAEPSLAEPRLPEPGGPPEKRWAR